MKYYLIALLLIIMGAGARTMFEIAHQALGREHDGLAPAKDTTQLILLALWFFLMVIPLVILLRNKDLRNRNVYVALLSVSILGPSVYMLLTH